LTNFLHCNLNGISKFFACFARTKKSWLINRGDTYSFFLHSRMLLGVHSNYQTGPTNHLSMRSDSKSGQVQDCNGYLTIICLVNNYQHLIHCKNMCLNFFLFGALGIHKPVRPIGKSSMHDLTLRWITKLQYCSLLTVIAAYRVGTG